MGILQYPLITTFRINYDESNWCFVLSSIEIGKKWISPNTLAKLSSALKIESYELFKPQAAGTTDMQRRTDEIFQTIRNSIDKIQLSYRVKSR